MAFTATGVPTDVADVEPCRRPPRADAELGTVKAPRDSSPITDSTIESVSENPDNVAWASIPDETV